MALFGRKSKFSQLLNYLFHFQTHISSSQYLQHHRNITFPQPSSTINTSTARNKPLRSLTPFPHLDPTSTWPISSTLKRPSWSLSSPFSGSSNSPSTTSSRSATSSSSQSSSELLSFSPPRLASASRALPSSPSTCRSSPTLRSFVSSSCSSLPFSILSSVFPLFSLMSEISAIA
ncbi:hypothetical protein HZ326_28495 [Fusarium oxysporum f. sp. albedinis]|nr:hypothetical protein HZ326_28495 [Fusarium oxysporum f. sp. albedinis]